MKKCCTKDCNKCPRKVVAAENKQIKEVLTFSMTLFGLVVALMIITIL